MTGLNPPSLAAIYGARLQADRDAYAVAEQVAAVEGTTADLIWRRWREAAQDHERAAGHTLGLTLAQQSAANARVHGIAQHAAAQLAAQQARAARRSPVVAFQEDFYVANGRWPSLAEQRAAGVRS
jgi:hypothetical protein